MKVTAPGFSLDASGSLGGAIVASKWKGRNYFRELVRPSNPKSGSQVGVRAMFKFLAQYWASLSTANQATWQDLADQLVASPFNGFMSANQKRWRNFLAPGQEDPVGGTGTQDTYSGWAATAGVRQVTLDITVGVANDGWGVAIFRGATGFTPAFSNCIAVIPAVGAADYSFVDTPLDPGTYYYNARGFTTDGSLDSAQGEVSATVA